MRLRREEVKVSDYESCSMSVSTHMGAFSYSKCGDHAL